MFLLVSNSDLLSTKLFFAASHHLATTELHELTQFCCSEEFCKNTKIEALLGETVLITGIIIISSVVSIEIILMFCTYHQSDNCYQ